ncbi:MAG: FecR domain-containing protein [Pseudomonadota bacterium]
MPAADEDRLVREATRLFLRLRQAPSDPTRVAARDRFLERGVAECAAYNEVERAWAITGAGRRGQKRTFYALALVACVAVSAYAASGALRNAWLASHRTAEAPAAHLLASGDEVVLDAGTALRDATDGGERRVAVLAGAAFFEVAPDDRPFRVEIGGLEASVLGTAFETVRIGEAVTVAVAKGRVAVTADGERIVLGAGDRLDWLPGRAPKVTEIDPNTIAEWREDRLLAEGLSFAAAAEIIDRRLAGPVVVLSPALGRARVSGGLDLGQPLRALETLAAAEGARVISLGPVATLVLPAR